MAQTVTQNKDNDLIQTLKEILDTLGLSEEQQKKVLQDLDKAILLNLVGRLESQLSPDQKGELFKQEPENLEDVAKFLGDSFSKDDLKKSLTASVEEVVGKFLDKI